MVMLDTLSMSEHKTFQTSRINPELNFEITVESIQFRALSGLSALQNQNNTTYYSWLKDCRVLWVLKMHQQVWIQV